MSELTDKEWQDFIKKLEQPRKTPKLNRLFKKESPFEKPKK